MCILLALVHLLLELLCFLLIGKRQTGQAVLELKGVEEGTVLVVLERVVDFLVPDDAAVGGLDRALAGHTVWFPWTYRDVDHLDPEGIADQVIGEDYSALQAGILPSIVVWVGNVQLGHGDSMDLVGSLGHLPLDILLVVVVQYRGHSEGMHMCQFTVAHARVGESKMVKLLVDSKQRARGTRTSVSVWKPWPGPKADG